MIRTLEEHEEALDRLVDMIEADPVPGSPEANDLIDLARDIEEYEDEYYPMTLTVVKTIAGLEKTG